MREALAALAAALAEPEQKPEPVLAQHRFRRPQKGSPNWGKWHECSVRNRPAWEIDSQGFEVEYRLLYTAPPAAALAEPEHIHTCPPDCQKPLCVNRRREVAAAVEAEREAILAHCERVHRSYAGHNLPFGLMQLMDFIRARSRK
jgi:hypothetical protein